MRTNVSAQLYRAGGQRDIFATSTYAAPVPIRCGIVHLLTTSQQTPVRADSSASHGSAEDEVVDAKLLLPVSLKVAIGDVIQILGTYVEVTGRHPRINTRGGHDHDQIDGKVRDEL